MESRWVDLERGGAEVGLAGARAARSSGGGRGMGGARAQLQTAARWSPNLGPPRWRFLPGACSGAARRGPARGRRRDRRVGAGKEMGTQDGDPGQGRAVPTAWR